MSIIFQFGNFKNKQQKNNTIILGERKILVQLVKNTKSFAIAMLKRCSVKLTSKKQFAVVGV